MQLFVGFSALTVIILDEDDIATYTIKTIDDRRTLNKTVYLRPPENILTQRQLVEKWEKLLGRTLEKFSISAEEFLASMKGKMKIKYLFTIFLTRCDLLFLLINMFYFT